MKYLSKKKNPTLGRIVTRNIRHSIIILLHILHIHILQRYTNTISTCYIYYIIQVMLVIFSVDIIYYCIYKYKLHYYILFFL